jgi:hypothetical protein
MIQRIQTLYLLLTTALLIASLCLPYGAFVSNEGIVYLFSPLQLSAIDQQTHSTWALFLLLLLAAVIACGTIFLFKNRGLQMRMCIFNIVLLVGYYIVFLVFLFVFKSQLDASFRLQWAICLPLVSGILLFLAFRAIGKDENLVKAADRLR